MGGIADQVHVYDQASLDAVNTAITASRPLLVRGEPGVGKSQLARAVAKSLGYAFVARTVDIQTEAQDLLWHFDAVRRLAEAQLQGALEGALAGLGHLAGDDNTDHGDAARDRVLTRLRQEIHVSKFLEPGPLWWAFDWGSALEQAKRAGTAEPPQPDRGDPEKGCVLLIDEIDKAETDVPNGLLEALGNGEFSVFGRDTRIARGNRPLVVIITTNEERALPDAFIRRCFVLHLTLPSDDKALVDHLVTRGQKHFGRALKKAVLTEAAEQLVADRNRARDNQLRPLPGQAEYLDLLRALTNHPDGETEEGQLALLARIKGFALNKNAGAHGP